MGDSFDLALNIENNFDESNRQVSDSVLPKVRSDVVRYLNEGESGLEKLIIEGRDTLGRSLHYRGFVGVLEEMYSGAGGEILYWPAQSRLAFGASLAYAKQRDYDRGLGLLDYDVITGMLAPTGPLRFIIMMSVHAVDILQRISCNIEVSGLSETVEWAWATLPMPFEDFGEGSFKRLLFSDPLDSVFGGNSRSNRYQNGQSSVTVANGWRVIQVLFSGTSRGTLRRL